METCNEYSCIIFDTSILDVKCTCSIPVSIMLVSRERFETLECGQVAFLELKTCMHTKMYSVHVLLRLSVFPAGWTCENLSSQP